MEKDEKIIFGAAAVIAIVMIGIKLGSVGSRTMIGFFLLWFLSYWLVKPLRMASMEKVVISLLLGIGLFPTIMYWVAFITGIKLAIAVTAVIFIILALIVNRPSVQKKIAGWL